jgi:hypothetical protein
LSTQDCYGCNKLTAGISRLILYGGNASLTIAEQDLYLRYCFLNHRWISNPGEYDSIDPEIKNGLIAILEIESKRAQKDKDRAEAQERLAKAQGKMK